MSQRELPTGAVALNASRVMAKLSKKYTWLFCRPQVDPSFPKPFYIEGRPHWLENELDDWLRMQMIQGKPSAKGKIGERAAAPARESVTA